MADPLSAAAGTLAVIGAADVLLRAGKELSKLCDGLKSAPDEVKKLRRYIQDIAGLVENARLVAERTQAEAISSVSATASSSNSSPSKALIQLEGVLQDLSDELSALVGLARKYDAVNSALGKVKWVLELKVRKSSQRLEQSKLSLVAALVMIGYEFCYLDLYNGAMTYLCAGKWRLPPKQTSTYPLKAQQT